MFRRIAMFMLCAALLTVCMPQAEAQQMLFINGDTASRVHLRKEPDKSSDSLGLYYSGTPAACLSQQGEWMQVLVGTQTGYVHSSLLLDPDAAQHMQVKWHEGTVHLPPDRVGKVNLRTHPSERGGRVLLASEGDSVLVLGETHDHWYYVKLGDSYGYMMSEYVRRHDSAPMGRMYAGATLPDGLAGSRYYSSGAGAWQTQLVIMPNGMFVGFYQDADLGDTGPGYPNGTVYRSLFMGRLGPVRHTAEGEHRFTVEACHFFGIQHEAVIEDKLRCVTTGAPGVGVGDEFSLYALTAANLPEAARLALQNHSTDGLDCFVYNHTAEATFLP